MLFVAIGIILMIVIYKKEYQQEGVVRDSWEIILIGIFFIAMGLFLPLSGYKDPVLESKQDLFPIGPINSQDDTTSNAYLLVKVFGDKNKFTYCVNTDGLYDVVSRNKGDVEVVVEDVETPVVEKYISKAKSSIFTCGLWFDGNVYVIKVSPEMIQYAYSS